MPNEPFKVHQYGEGTSAAGWYFWDQSTVRRVGPFETESEAIYACETYTHWLEEQEKEAWTF